MILRPLKALQMNNLLSRLHPEIHRLMIQIFTILIEIQETIRLYLIGIVENSVEMSIVCILTARRYPNFAVYAPIYLNTLKDKKPA